MKHCKLCGKELTGSEVICFTHFGNWEEVTMDVDNVKSPTRQLVAQGMLMRGDKPMFVVDHTFKS